jgi:hypothetical protein
VVNEFQSLGYDGVSRPNLHYRLENFIKEGAATLFSERECSENVTLANITELSPLTDDNNLDDNVVTALSTIQDNMEDNIEDHILEDNKCDLTPPTIEGESNIAKKRREGIEKKKQQK